MHRVVSEKNAVAEFNIERNEETAGDPYLKHVDAWLGPGAWVTELSDRNGFKTGVDSLEGSMRTSPCRWKVAALP